jgi:hypothetical protein
VVENPDEIPEEDGDVREERNKIAAIMANRWEFPVRDCQQEVVDPDSLNCDPDSAFQENPDPAPDPRF